MICGSCKENECPPKMTRCRRCNAEYRKRRETVLVFRAMERGRREGCEAFRMLVIQVFEDRWPELELNGRSAADIVREIRVGQ